MYEVIVVTWPTSASFRHGQLSSSAEFLFINIPERVVTPSCYCEKSLGKA